MKLFFALIASLLLSQQWVCAGDCPQFEPPSGARLSWVSQNMMVNGIPMAILQVDSDRNPASMIAHYRTQWSQSGQVTEYPVGAWQAIATARARCFYTFQTKPVGTGSTGFLSVSTALKKPAANPPKFPMPANSQVITDIEHKDDFKNGRTVFLRNDLTLDSNAIFYRNNLADQGWTISAERKVNTKKGQGVVFDLQRERNLAMLTVSRSDGHTYVLFNYMDRP